MASVERTAYPRLKKILTGRELNEFYARAEEEAILGRSTVSGDRQPPTLFRSSFQDLSTVLLFPDLQEISFSVVNHVRDRLGSPASTESF